MPEALMRLLPYLLCLALGVAIGHTWRDNTAGKEIATMQRDAKEQERQRAEAVAARAEEQRREDQRTISLQRQALNEEHQRRVDAEISLRRVDGALGRLRSENGTLRERIAALDPALASSRAATLAALDLYADLLERCGAQYRDVARVADEAASAGQLCVQSYEALNASP